MRRKPLPKKCHCGSGKFPGTMREHGWCCGVCHNDFRRCPGPPSPADPRTCKRKIDGKRCGAVLTIDDKLDNISGWCAECASDTDAFFA